MLKRKRVIIFGERDEIAGNTIQTVLEAAGAEVLFAHTKCFVWEECGAVGPTEQENVKKLMETNAAEDTIVVVGFNVTMEKEDPAGELRLMAETFKNGDPTFAGPLADTALGLKTYHVLELKEFVPAEVWEEQLGFKEEFEFSDEQKALILETLREIRKS